MTESTSVRHAEATRAGGTEQSAAARSAAIAAELQKLDATPKGLSSSEAASRHARYGRNAIVAHTESRWHQLAAYFWGPLPWMIEAAALISLVRRDWSDFFVVGGLLLYNAAVGFWQDYKASDALAALRKGLAPKARVLRDGVWQSIDAAELVPGDVVNVTAGQIVPADLLLIEGEYLSVDQAALTGESLPVTRKVGDAAYSGAIAKQGTMTGVVTKTGNNTFFGRTAKLVAAAGSASHSQKAVLQIGDFLIIVALALAVVLISVEAYRRIVVADSWDWTTVGSIAQFVLILLVASIPVALPAVMSVTMAIGAYALSRQKAILSRLSAIEIFLPPYPSAPLLLFNLAMNAGPNATTFSLAPELFPTSVRATASGFAAATAKIGATLGIFVLPQVKQAWGVVAVLVMMAVVSALGAAVTAALARQIREIPEGRGLDETSAIGRPKS